MVAELDALEQAWRRGDWLGGSGANGCLGDPTQSRACYLMDQEDALRNELATLRATMDEAQALAVGVGKLLGQSYAAALLLRYLESRPWSEVAVLLGVCERTAYSRVSTALDLVDAMGPAKVKAGMGMAAA